MNALEYAQLEDSMDYLYDFFDEDLEARVRAEREYLPESLQDLLGDHSVLDYIWLWIKEPGKTVSRPICAMAATRKQK